jgi:hypothetical protein
MFPPPLRSFDAIETLMRFRSYLWVFMMSVTHRSSSETFGSLSWGADKIASLVRFAPSMSRLLSTVCRVPLSRKGKGMSIRRWCMKCKTYGRWVRSVVSFLTRSSANFLHASIVFVIGG